MKYKNANDVLPSELLEQIQEYVQGEYLYIPVKEKFTSEVPTEYKIELEKRDIHIYTKYLEGLSNKRLAEIYNLSESSIRRIIIKQRKGYTVMKEKIKEMLVNWGLQNSEIKQIYDNSWQVGEDYVLKIYSDLETLQRNLKTTRTLDKMNIPVSKAILTTNNSEYIECENGYCFIYKKLQGSNIVKIRNDKKFALNLGEIIANLHIAFKNCESDMVFWNNSLLDEMNGWIKDNFENNGWRYITKADYEKLVSDLSELYGDLPVQLIHRDVHFGNFLFAEGRFSGYIDFDLSQRNIRIFDLCYFLLGLLSEKEKFEITDDIWFEFVTNVFAGYNSKIELTNAEKQAVPYVMECIELLFVSYFHSQNDIKCAESAYAIFQFVSTNKDRIVRNIRQACLSL